MRIGSRRLLLSPSAVSFDPDALAYFTAAGITSASEKAAVNNFFVQLKANGFWDKIIRIYLFSSTSLDAASYCAKTLTTGTFINAPTLSSLGVLFDGSTQYFLLPTTVNTWLGATEQDLSVSIYQNNTLGLSDPSNVWMGAGRFDNAGQLSFTRLITSRNLVGRSGTVSLDLAILNQTTGIGFYVMNRVGTAVSFYKDGVLADSETLASTSLVASQLSYGARFATGTSPLVSSYSNVRVGLGVFSTAIDASDQANFNSIVSSFLTAIGRLV